MRQPLSPGMQMREAQKKKISLETITLMENHESSLDPCEEIYKQNVLGHKVMKQWLWV